MNAQPIAPLALWAVCHLLLGPAHGFEFREDCSAVVDGTNAVVIAGVQNTGGEIACVVELEAALQERTGRTRCRDVLKPHDSLQARIDLGPAPRLPGAYTIPLILRFAETNGYHHSLPRWTTLTVGEVPSAGTQLRAMMSLPGPSQVRVVIENNRAQSQRATVSLILPDELACKKPRRSIEVPPRGRVALTFRVQDSLARSPGEQHVGCVIDWEAQGRHHSGVLQGAVAAGVPAPMLPPPPAIGWTLGLGLLAVFLCGQFPRSRSLIRHLDLQGRPWKQRAVEWGILGGTAALLLHYIPLSLVLTDTTITGGDMPGHPYLVSELRRQILEEGRIIGWATGWWCGFPLFQFYFPLPYLLAVLLSFVLPLNVALKLVSVSGLYLLPFCAYGGARMARAPRPLPVLAGISTIPVLFDVSQTMWGVNILSTFSGMIANSVSFSVMLLFMGAAVRDVQDGRFRAGTSALFAGVIGTHFFTSIVCGMGVAMLPFLQPRPAIGRALRIVIAELALGGLLMAWWLVPLIAKRAYSVDFGANWEVSFFDLMPRIVLGSLPLALAGIALGMRRRTAFVSAMACLLLVALFLFAAGGAISPVFVNVRLWPFIVYACLILAAAGAGLLLAGRSHAEWALAAAWVIAVTAGIPPRNDIRNWAVWTYSGMEIKPNWKVFEELVRPLDGSPGLLANDMDQAGASMGSYRIFECVPHVVNKPVLEGGIVNSAASALFIQHIRSQITERTQSNLILLEPGSFDFENAVKLLRLFGVRHFIARGQRTRESFDAAADWRRVREARGWVLYEDTAQDGRKVFIPARQPLAVRVRDWQKAAVRWVRAPEQPFVLLGSHDSATEFERALTEDELDARLASLADGHGEQVFSLPAAPQGRVLRETVTPSRIAFETTALGAPHVIRCTYSPNWKVTGADRVYLVTPCFLLVYPRESRVELRYGYTGPDIAGYVLTLLGCAAAAGSLIVPRRRRPKSAKPE